MNHLLQYWFLYFTGLVVMVAAVLLVIQFIRYPRATQLKKVKEWLLYAVAKAEKELGSGTGRLKLRFVYDLFLVRFSWLSMLITFDLFSRMVDEALIEFRELLETNQYIEDLVKRGDTHGTL